MKADNVLHLFLKQSQSKKYIGDLNPLSFSMTDNQSIIWVQLVTELIEQQMRDVTIGVKGSAISNFLENRI